MWCKFCGEFFQWLKDDDGKFIPLDNKGRDHRLYCKKDKEYMEKEKRILGVFGSEPAPKVSKK